MSLLTAPEIATVMAYPPEARHYAWVTLLAQGRATVDMIREAEGLEEAPGRTVTDDYAGAYGGDWGSADLYADPSDRIGLDMTDGVTMWIFHLTRAIFLVLLALGAVTAIRLAGRLLGFERKEH